MWKKNPLGEGIAYYFGCYWKGPAGNAYVLQFGDKVDGANHYTLAYNWVGKSSWHCLIINLIAFYLHLNIINVD